MIQRGMPLRNLIKKTTCNRRKYAIQWTIQCVHTHSGSGFLIRSRNIFMDQILQSPQWKEYHYIYIFCLTYEKFRRRQDVLLIVETIFFFFFQETVIECLPDVYTPDTPCCVDTQNLVGVAGGGVYCVPVEKYFYSQASIRSTVR